MAESLGSVDCHVGLCVLASDMIYRILCDYRLNQYVLGDFAWSTPESDIYVLERMVSAGPAERSLTYDSDSVNDLSETSWMRGAMQHRSTLNDCLGLKRIWATPGDLRTST